MTRRGGWGSAARSSTPPGCTCAPGLASAAEPVLLADDYGQVAVYGIPYLEPPARKPPAREQARRRGSRRCRRGAAPRGHQAVLGAGAGPGPLRRRVAGAMTRTVVLAHGWVTGGQASESERDIRVGGVGDVPASLFDGFSYGALGHLHGQQKIADHLRYSGSPLPYSFSEARHKKGTWLVELGDGGKLAVERVPAPVYRRLSVLRGRLDDLLASAEYRRPGSGLPRGDAHRPRPARGGDGPAAAAVPARADAGVRARGRDRGRALLPRAGRRPR